MKRLQYISDLHLERKKSFPQIQKKAEYFTLLGDIGDPWSEKYKDFLSYSSDHWKKTFLIAGNHEYYFSRSRGNDGIKKTEDQIRLVTEKFPNVKFLQRQSEILEDYEIFGLTLFPKRTKDKFPVPIHDLFEKERVLDTLWLERVIEKPSKKIFLSHYLPSSQLIVEPYLSQFPKNRHQNWYSPRENFFHPSVKAWLCGHSHVKIQKMIKSENGNWVKCCINASTEDSEYINLE